ncbi:MAG: maleylpyruvate isomerase N-terminal domain-containing protein [Actinomycetota bacterium]|nr:maleylpyruvate isomerase N-terminal domain-containing protein [Actinomycetota bacterium]
MLRTTDASWAEARAAVASAATRVGALLRSVRHPDAPALGKWNVTDVAVHLSHVVDAIAAMAKGGGSFADDVWSLSKLTEGMVKAESTRDLSALADRIETSVADYLTVLEASEENGLRKWMVKGVELPLSTLTCQILNELTVHGRDIAVADGQPWPIERSHAALIVCGFLFPVLGVLKRTMVEEKEAAGLRACMEVRVRGGCRVYLRFDDGDLAVEEAPWRPVDCRLSVDPAAFLLVAWGRVDQWGPISRGQLLAWGRKPWLGLKLRALLRNA